MKKLTALLLALLMVLALMACAAKDEPMQEAEKPADSEQKPAEDKKEEEKQEEEKEEPETPAEPEIIPGTLPLVAEGEEISITIGLNQNPNTENYDTNEYTLWIEEQTGVDLQFVYFSSDKTEATTQLNLMLSGGQELPDILWGFGGINNAMMYEMGQDGYLVDIKDYFDQYAYFFNQSAETIVNEQDRNNLIPFGISPLDGGLYAFPRYSQKGNTDQTIAAVSINTKWLEAVDAEMPTTVDELYEVLKLFASEDLNGNGLMDEIPMVGYDGYRASIDEYIINAFVYCNDEFIFNATNGKLWVPYTTNEYREAMIYLNKLYDEGLLSSMVYTIADNAEMTSLFTPSDQIALAGVIAAHPTLTTEKENPVMYEYAALPPLKGATELGGYGALHPNTFEYNCFITTDCENPVLAFRLLDFMSSQESLIRQRYGVLDRDWTWAEEGELNSAGTQAAFKVLDSSIYSSQNNGNWHVVAGTIGTRSLFSGTWIDDGSWDSERTKLNTSIWNVYEAAGLPDEVVYTLLYNAEEQEVASELAQPLKDYIDEARAQFISGVMDPNNDTDWNNYLSNLEAQGMSDWLAVAQSAYTRMNG